MKIFIVCMKVCFFPFIKFSSKSLPWNLKKKTLVKKKIIQIQTTFLHNSLTDNYESNAITDKSRNFKVCHLVRFFKIHNRRISQCTALLNNCRLKLNKFIGYPKVTIIRCTVHQKRQNCMICFSHSHRASS